jgi:hypothetical protein
MPISVESSGRGWGNHDNEDGETTNDAFNTYEKAKDYLVEHIGTGRRMSDWPWSDIGPSRAAENRFGAVTNQFRGHASHGAGHKAGCGQAATHRGGALLDALQPVPSGALSNRADGGAMENHHASHAGARESSREAGKPDFAILAGKQRSLSGPSIT